MDTQWAEDKGQTSTKHYTENNRLNHTNIRNDPVVRPPLKLTQSLHCVPLQIKQKTCLNQSKAYHVKPELL